MKEHQSKAFNLTAIIMVIMVLLLLASSIDAKNSAQPFDG